MVEIFKNDLSLLTSALLFTRNFVFKLVTDNITMALSSGETVTMED